MHFKVLAVFILISFIGCKEEKPLTLTFTGDVILDRGVADEMRLHGDSLLVRRIRPFLKSDFNFVNLETVLTKEHVALQKQFALKADPSVADWLSPWVSHASVANNHSYDFGEAGFRQTLGTLKALKITDIGVGCTPTIVSKGNQQVAVLAASLVTNNEHLCIGNRGKLIEAIKAFRKSDYKTPLIVYVHWGLEYQQQPEVFQVQVAHQIIDEGADAIVGHHPHVLQNIEFYKGKPIIYSLGNFVADAYLPRTTSGAVAHLTIQDTMLSVALERVDLSSYFPEQVSAQPGAELIAEDFNFSTGVCFYISDNRFFIKPIDQVNFKENTNHWLVSIGGRHTIGIRKSKDDLYILSLHGKDTKSMALHGQLSEIAIEDINNDLKTELLLGVSKAVHFDPQVKKRLNIFSIENGGFKTVWLGTKFIHDLVSYDVLKKDRINYLETLERDSLDQLYKATYSWDEFGFELDEMKPVHENL